jgi:ribosomal protein S18 acetylase RimI-like enzyme
MTPTKTCPPIHRRTVTTADDGLLRALFEQSRDDLAWLPPEVVDRQYRARARQLAHDHPDAATQVLVVEGLDVGALVLDAQPDGVRVVDIVIARAHRGRGIAGNVLSQVITEAGTRAVRLSVWSGNDPARALYDKLGFTALSHGAGYVQMERQPDLSNRFVDGCA